MAGHTGPNRGSMAGKMVQIEKMTECSLGNEMNETDGGECTIDEGTEKPSFRVGEDIASVLARLGDEDMGYFHSRLKVETKIKRTGYHDEIGFTCSGAHN